MTATIEEAPPPNVNVNTKNKPPEPTMERLFQVLTENIQKHGAGAQKRIVAHIRAVTGKNLALPVFYNSAAIPEPDKRAIIKTCINALLKQDYSRLQGQVGNG